LKPSSNVNWPEQGGRGRERGGALGKGVAEEDVSIYWGLELEGRRRGGRGGGNGNKEGRQGAWRTRQSDISGEGCKGHGGGVRPVPFVLEHGYCLYIGRAGAATPTWAYLNPL